MRPQINSNSSGRRAQARRLNLFRFFFSGAPREPSGFRSALMVLFLVAMVALAQGSCALDQKRGAIPPQAQAAIETAGEDMAEGRYEKLYAEAAQEWKSANTPEQSAATFKVLRDKLGGVKSRSYQTASEQQTSSGRLPGHSLTVTYYTTFERGEGMETFTLVERDGRWQLARYFVNSNALK